MAELHSPFAPLTVCPNVPCSVDSGTERAGEEGGAAVPKRKQLLRREGTEMQTRPGTWEVAGRRGEEGPPRELIGGRGRGRSLAGRLQPAEAPLCVNFCTKMGPQIQGGDTGALPGSASRTIC